MATFGNTATLDSLCYDGRDGLLQEQTPQGTVNYTYDASERRATMTPASQMQIVYTFDNANRLTNIVQGSQSVTIGYDNANRRMLLSLPNGVAATYGYDNANELTGITYKTSSGTTLGTLAYTYDVAGQRLTRTGSLASDLLPTPTSATDTFDLNNRQTIWSGYPLGYDVNGDQISNAATSPLTAYTFDVRHRLTQIMQGSSTLASFSYDTMGRRTGKTVGAATIGFLYDGQNPVQEMQGGTTSAILTGLGIDERFERQEAAGARYFMTDALGSTVALSDASQVLQQTYSYEPYGEATSTGSSSNSYQYAGRESDGTGLYYFRARYYSPTLKRFISEDPDGLDAGLNEYIYDDDDPTDLSDPSGLKVMACIRPLNPQLFGQALVSLNRDWVHEFLCAQTSTESDPVCKGLGPDPKKPSKLEDDDPSKALCTEVPDPGDCMSKCIESNWKSPLPEYSEFTGQGMNCQQYVGDIIGICKIECHMK